MSHSIATQSQFLTLRAQGLSYDTIAKTLHVSKHTLLKWAKALQPQLDALQAAALETALEKYQVVLLQRVEFFAQQFQRIQEAIIRCDLKSSYTPRLFYLLLKLHATLEQFDFNPSSCLPIENPKSEIQNSLSPNPANIHLAGTESAPSVNQELGTMNNELTSPPSTISAPVSSSPLTEHQALSTEHFLSTPPESPDTTEIAPKITLSVDPSTSTETAPVSSSSCTEHQALCTEHFVPPSCNSCQKNPAELVEAKLLEFTTHYRRQHHTDPPEGELQKFHQILKRLDRMETKIAS